MEVLFGGFFLFFLLFTLLAFVPLAFWIYALVEAVRAPEPAFGPPWDNSKNAWVLGIVVALFIPFASIVVAALWWMQGRKALRAGALVPRPFWAPAPRYYPPPNMPPGTPGAPPQGGPQPPQPPQGYGG